MLGRVRMEKKSSYKQFANSDIVLKKINREFAKALLEIPQIMELEFDNPIVYNALKKKTDIKQPAPTNRKSSLDFRRKKRVTK